MKICLVLAALVAAASITAAQVSGGPVRGPAGPHCPDTKACQVQGSSGPATGATIHKCGIGIGIVIFGIGGSIVGEDCPTTLVTTPAHQECHGATNPGTACVPQGTLPVNGRHCECGGLVIPGIRIGIPTDCECGDSFPFGTIEDAQTISCQEEEV